MKKIIVLAIIASAALIILFSCRVDIPGIGTVTVTFADTDMGSGQIAGTVSITGAPDTADVTHFVLYWGSSLTEKLAGADAIGEIEYSGGDVSLVIADNTLLPAGATHILAYTKNANGESEQGAGAQVIDRGSTVTITLSHTLSGVSSFSLNVTADDMGPVTAAAAASATQITAEVPEGTDRLFKVIAQLDPAGPSIFISFSGEVTSDISPGVPTSLALTVNVIDTTKILIPDYYNLDRLVQIDDMSGANWTEIDYSNLTGFVNSYEFQPYDVDFDNNGNIYIANFCSSTGYIRVIKLANMSDASPELLPGSDKATNIRSLTVDRINSLLYYSVNSNPPQLWRCNLDGSGDTQLTTTVIYGIMGMAAGPDGMLYIAGIEDTTYDSKVFKYNPSTQSVTASYGPTNLDTPWDVMVKAPYVYVANYNSTGFQILQFDTSLNYIKGFGDDIPPTSTPGAGEFFGPHRFLAVLNKKFYVIDENESSSAETERIVSFSDMTGSDWDSFDPSEVGKSAFSFFNMY